MCSDVKIQKLLFLLPVIDENSEISVRDHENFGTDIIEKQLKLSVSTLKVVLTCL